MIMGKMGKLHIFHFFVNFFSNFFPNCFKISVKFCVFSILTEVFKCFLLSPFFKLRSHKRPELLKMLENTFFINVA
jgi:hypothetical protein